MKRALRNLGAVLAHTLSLSVVSGSVVGTGVVLAGLAVTSDAQAASGSVRVQNTRLDEGGGGTWHLFVTLELPKPPPIAHVPLKFIFTRTMAYELSLVDGKNDPQETQQSLSGQQPSTESLDVDFADGTGKIFKGTRFDFGITRTRGFLPGEYKMQVRTSDGLDIGSPTTITLLRTKNKDDANYKNDVVDRRSITFNAKSGSIKKVDNGVDAGAKATNDETSSAGNGNGDVAPAGSAPPFIPPEAYQKQPEEVTDHPKGCGCSVPGGDRTTGLWFLGLPIGAAIFGVRARKREKKEKR